MIKLFTEDHATRLNELQASTLAKGGPLQEEAKQILNSPTGAWGNLSDEQEARFAEINAELQALQVELMSNPEIIRLGLLKQGQGLIDEAVKEAGQGVFAAIAEMNLTPDLVLALFDDVVASIGDLGIQEVIAGLLERFVTLSRAISNSDVGKELVDLQIDSFFSYYNSARRYFTEEQAIQVAIAMCPNMSSLQNMPSPVTITKS